MSRAVEFPHPPEPATSKTGSPDEAGRRRPSRREVSTARLLEAAASLFIRQGYHATSVDQIVEAAGYTKGAVYFYFRSKAGLLDQLLGRVEAVVVEPTIAAVATAGERPQDQLVAFLHSQSMVGQKRAESMLLAILMSIEFHGSGHPIEERLSALMSRLAASLSQILETGQQQGLVRTDLDSRHLAALLMAVNQGCFIEWYRRGDELDGEALVRTLRTFVLSGIHPPDRDRPNGS